MQYVSNNTTDRFSDYPSKANGELVTCSNCGRGFAKERIETHVKICTNTKERKIYDIAKIRIVGTEAEELYKAGEYIYITSRAFKILGEIV